MRICPTWLAALLCVLASAFPVEGSYFESASLGQTGVSYPGPVIFNNLLGSQFYGVRFQVVGPVQVTAVGAHIVGNPSAQLPLFAAIVELAGPGAIPTDSRLSNVLASATFLPELASSDLKIPLSVQLVSGYYGLVFGAGMFGSPAGAEATLIDSGIASASNLPDAYFAYTSLSFPGFGGFGDWQAIGGSNVRMVVDAFPLHATSLLLAETPEPTSGLLVLAGFIGFVFLPLNRRARCSGQTSG